MAGCGDGSVAVGGWVGRVSSKWCAGTGACMCRPLPAVTCGTFRCTRLCRRRGSCRSVALALARRLQPAAQVSCDGMGWDGMGWWWRGGVQCINWLTGNHAEFMEHNFVARSRGREGMPRPTHTALLSLPSPHSLCATASLVSGSERSPSLRCVCVLRSDACAVEGARECGVECDDQKHERLWV